MKEPREHNMKTPRDTSMKNATVSAFSVASLWEALNTIVNNRTHMYRNNLCEVTASKTASLQKIKRHLEHAKGYKILGLCLLMHKLRPDFENIMPGDQSKFYASIVGKWNWIKENIEPKPEQNTPNNGL